MPPRESIWSMLSWLAVTPVLMLVFWEPMSRLFPAAPWPSRLVTLFLWIVFAEGALYSIFAAIYKAKALIDRYMYLLFAIFNSSVCVLLTFDGQIRSIASAVAGVTLATAVLISAIPRLRSG